MLKNYQSLKVASTFMATTLALAVTAQNVKAIDFSFSGFTAGTYTGSGTFRISNSTPEGSIAAADFEDWIITLDDGSTQEILYGPGGNFGGTPNSSFFFNSFFQDTTLATFNSSELQFTNFWFISSPPGAFTNTAGVDAIFQNQQFDVILKDEQEQLNFIGLRTQGGIFFKLQLQPLHPQPFPSELSQTQA